MLQAFFIVGTVSSIIGAFIPVVRKRDRFIHILYGIVITILAVAYVNHDLKLNQVESVERSARHLMDDEGKYSTAGYIQAILTLLEKNSKLYPDAYARANKICELNDCLMTKYNKEVENSLSHSWSMIDLAKQLEGILGGLVVTNVYSE